MYLVVTGDGNVHMGEGRVSGGEGNDWDVDIWSLRDWLVVSTGVGHNQQAGLTESSLKALLKIIILFYHSAV